MFLRAIDWFNKASRLFSRCFRLKIGLNEFLGEKNMNLVLSELHHGSPFFLKRKFDCEVS